MFVPASHSGAPASIPAGVIAPYAGTAAPNGWLLCFGQAVSRTAYAALYAAIGTAFGAGDGATTFNLPDLRGRAPFGKDDMGGTAANRVTAAGSGINGASLGASGGAETVTLSTAQMPSHSHSVNQTNSSATEGGNPPTPSGAAASSTGSAGGGQAHQNMPPALVVNFIIKT